MQNMIQTEIDDKRIFQMKRIADGDYRKNNDQKNIYGKVFFQRLRLFQHITDSSLAGSGLQPESQHFETFRSRQNARTSSEVKKPLHNDQTVISTSLLVISTEGRNLINNNIKERFLVALFLEMT